MSQKKEKKRNAVYFFFGPVKVPNRSGRSVGCRSLPVVFLVAPGKTPALRMMVKSYENLKAPVIEQWQQLVQQTLICLFALTKQRHTHTTPEKFIVILYCYVALLLHTSQILLCLIQYKQVAEFSHSAVVNAQEDVVELCKYFNPQKFT